MAPQTANSDDPDVLARREVTRMLKGPVAERFQSLIPPLAGHADPYRTVMESPELLEACFKLFRLKRDAFADFLIDAGGAPVADDATRLKCGRSVDEIVGMVVRTGMRTFAEGHFGDHISPSKAKAQQLPKPAEHAKPFRLITIEKLSALFRRNYGDPKPLPPGQSKSGRFYAAVKDNLDYEWQVQFFPIYVEIPPHVFTRLGTGITRMDSEERLQRLAQMALADIQKAESVIKDPAMFQEMMEHNVLASATVTHMGEEGFESVHGALEHLDPQKKWNVLANKETAIRLLEDKRITKNDIAALAEYLDILNEFALDAIFDLNLNRDQMQMFLKTAEENLGPTLFLAMFGPIQTLVPEDNEEQQKLRRYQTFTQNALRSLVSAVKQLDESLRKSGGEGSIGECLGTVCRARRIDLEKEIKKLRPKSAL